MVILLTRRRSISFLEAPLFSMGCRLPPWIIHPLHPSYIPQSQHEILGWWSMPKEILSDTLGHGYACEALFRCNYKDGSGMGQDVWYRYSWTLLCLWSSVQMYNKDGLVPLDIVYVPESRCSAVKMHYRWSHICSCDNCSRLYVLKSLGLA